MLTRKHHYKAIAKAINYEGRELNTLGYMTGFEFREAREAIKRITLSLAIIFAADNPHFNRQKFIDACKGD